jgi:hypothetical protein
LDAARLKLAASHYVDAETCRDPVTGSGRHGARNISCPNLSRHHAHKPRRTRLHLRLSFC